MAANRLRRIVLLAASAAALALAACGGGSIVSQFTPTRIVAFGDGFADLGQAATSGARYTINDGTENNWSLTVARLYGRSLASTNAGGLSYATGNARVTATPDAAGNAGTATLTAQVNSFLAASKPTENDLLVVNAGTADIVAEMARQLAGTQTPAQTIANLQQAGREMAAQVRRLVTAGATHVVVVGPYNLERSPWAAAVSQKPAFLNASTAFNDALLVSMVDLGASVLYVDAALYINLISGSPSSYGLTNVTTPACTSVDSGAGIGTGAGQVNSALCTGSTLGAGVLKDDYLFADRVYPTPEVHRLFGAYAYERIHERW